MTCCPVPLATSRTTPCLGRTRARTSSIGPLLRSAAGRDHFPSACFSPRCRSMSSSSVGHRDDRGVAHVVEREGEPALRRLARHPKLRITYVARLELHLQPARDV